MQRLHVISV